jgi:PAS domain S-box-containing protein
MDAPSAVLLLLAIAGLLYGNAHRGLVALVTSQTLGGTQARLLLPASILIPIFVGWIRLLLERAGVLANEVGLIIHVVMTILLMAGAVWWNASTLVRSSRKAQSIEDALNESESAFRNMFSHASEAIYIADVHGNLHYLNPAAERLFGYRNQDAQGMNIKKLLRPAGSEPEVHVELLGGPSHPRRMMLAGPSRLPVDVSATVRFRNGNPVEVMAMVEPVIENEHEDEADLEIRPK